MSPEVLKSVIRRTRGAVLPGTSVTSESKVNDPLKVLAIGLTETYSHMAPWHVIMGQSFGASITYQLDAGKFIEPNAAEICFKNSRI